MQPTLECKSVEQVIFFNINIDFSSALSKYGLYISLEYDFQFLVYADDNQNFISSPDFSPGL